jgi:hypothetical protein
MVMQRREPFADLRRLENRMGRLWNRLPPFFGDGGEDWTFLLGGSERSARVVDMALEVAKAVGAEAVFFRVVQFPYYGGTAIDASYGTDYSCPSKDRGAIWRSS